MGVFTGLREGVEGLLRDAFIFLVGHAVPLIWAMENGNRGLTLVNQGIDYGGDVEFCFGVVLVVVEELEELAFDIGENIGVEPPEVHRDDIFILERNSLAIGIGTGDALLVTEDIMPFCNAQEGLLWGYFADAPGYGTIFGEGIAEEVADHGQVLPAALLAEESGHLPEGFRAVVVIGIDDGEGFVDDLSGHEDGMAGSPGFLSWRPVGDAGDGGIQFLEDVLRLDEVIKFGGEFFFEGLFDGMSDDENDFAKTCLNSVIDGVFHDGFAGGADAVHLFEAAITAADAGGQNEERRFHNIRFLVWLPSLR